MTNTKGRGLRTRHKVLANSSTKLAGAECVAALWLEGVVMLTWAVEASSTIELLEGQILGSR
jgi:hypothetical protein